MKPLPFALVRFSVLLLPLVLLPTTLVAQALPPAAPAHDVSEVPASRLRLSLTSTSAFGVSNGRFFNQLVGSRLDFRFTRRFAFGGALAYANLKGKDRRAHNVLPEAVLEYRVPLSGESFGLPLRMGAGFLPRNGPSLRLSAGLDLALGETVSIELIPIEPMVWVNRDRPEVSLNLSAALRMAW